MAIINIPSVLAEHANNEIKINIELDTVADVIAELVRLYPALKEYFYDYNSQISPHICIFVNEADMHSLNGPLTSVIETDEITIIPAIAGG